MVAIPTGILSAGFVEQVSIIREEAVIENVLHESAPCGEAEDKEDYSYCPYCGKKLP